MAKRNRAIVIGIDAATYNVIDYLTSKGKLGTFRTIIENGFSAVLKSCHPPITFPAWKCLTTGLNPGKLGVYSFFVWDKATGRIRVVSSRDFGAKDVWDYLGLCGCKVAVINVPGTFPPKKVNGYMVSGHFAFDSKDYTYPSGLKRFLVREYDYKAEFLRDIRTTPTKELTRDAVRTIEMRFDVTEYFLTEKDVDFVFSVISLTDNFEHHFWHLLGEDNNPIQRLYETIDRKLHELVLIARDKGFDIFLVSDHGMCEKKMEFELNSWLHLHKYLAFRDNPFAKNRSVKREILVNIVKKIGQNGRVMRFLSPKLVRFLSTRQIYKIASLLQGQERYSDVTLFDLVDWDKSSAFALGINCINVSRRNKKTASEIAGRLAKTVDRKTGAKVFREIRTKDEVYGEVSLGNPPDIVLVPDRGYLANSKISSSLDPNDYVKNGRAAIHDYDGVFLAYGSDIVTGNDHPSPTLDICDVTPTLLHKYGLSVEGLDGKSRLEALGRCSQVD